MTDRPRTLGELKQSGYRSLSVKQELRRNLLAKLRSGEPLFPGIRGYEDTVLPQVQNAILSGHDMLFLGLRGQGKTRMLRMLTLLLDDALPIIAGSEIHDDPLAPRSRFGKRLVEERGDDCPIEWIGRDERYFEKLATPDVTVADLIGEIDFVRHAEGKPLSSEDVLHFGLIPRAHRGIFCMNELPDLSPRIQVGLFNVLEERDVQIRGYPVRLDLDLCLVFSANPEDYTNRGRIVTPLKDRIGSVIRTHYPLTRELGMQITSENAWTERPDGVKTIVPHYVQQIIEELARLARTSPHVNQASGVSVRMSVANFENVASNAERRAVMNNEPVAVARVSDLNAVLASSRGKMELTLSEEPGEEDRLVGRLVDEAIKSVFDQSLSPKAFKMVAEYVEAGRTIELGDRLTAAQVLEQVRGLRGFAEAIESTARTLEPELARGDTALGLQAGVVEFVLEALHSHNRLNRKAKGPGTSYGG